MNRLVHCLALVVCHAVVPAVASEPVGPSQTHPGATVRWSEPVDGLSLGIEVPQSPLRLVAFECWVGPLTNFPRNPGVQWDLDATVTVFVKNVSDEILYWSPLFSVWSVSLTSADFEIPTSSPMSHPMVFPSGPISLMPGAVASKTLSVSGFKIWPKIPGGRYEVSVKYAPAPMLKFGRGGEGNWVHPFDIPGFWAGTIRTPTIEIQVHAYRGYSFNFNFADGPQGWSHGFSDYPVGEEGFYKLKADYRPLPAFYGAGSGLFMSGNNHNGDLFMYLRRKIDGLEPGRDYQLSFHLQLITNAPRGCMGAGGAPGESVYVKVGACPQEPKPVPKDGQYRLSADKGEQARDGRHAVVVGNVAGGHSDCSGNGPYASKGLGGYKIVVSASEAGELWLFFGTDSGYEGTTSLYYTRLRIYLTPR